MKKRKGSLLQRMLAVLLSGVLVFSMVSDAASVTALANEPGGRQESMDESALAQAPQNRVGEETNAVVIAAFAPLAEEIKEQTVPVGTALGALSLPEKLTVYLAEEAAEEDGEGKGVSGGSQDGTEREAPVTIGDVTWQAEPEYDGETEGLYLFTAVLPDGYALAEGVEPPGIAVTVEGDMRAMERTAVMLQAATHKHPVCGASCGHSDGTHPDDVEWTALTQDSITGDSGSITINGKDYDCYNLSAGNYYLTEDISIDRVLKTSGEVNLCFNGHTITSTLEGTNSNVASLIVYYKFNACDCGSGGGFTNSGQYVFLSKSATSNLYGGKFSGGCAVYVYGGTFTLDGATLEATNAAVNIQSISKAFIKSGSVISSGNTSVYIYTTNPKNFIMSGGTVTNTKSNGSALSFSYDEAGTITGGTITASGSSGKGVEILNRASVILSGSPAISGGGGDICVAGNSKITADNLTAKYDINYAFTASGITEAAPVTFTVDAPNDYSEYFAASDALTKSGLALHKTGGSGNEQTLEIYRPHKITHYAEVPATCTADGTGEYWKCTNKNCGKLFSDADGKTEITDIPVKSALGHNKEGSVAHKDATCTEAGVQGGSYCARCDEGKSEAETVIPATGHDYRWTITKTPTATAEGTAEGVCENDNSHKGTKTLPALTDTTVWTAGDKVEPTKDQDGSQAYTSEYGTVTVTFPSYTKIAAAAKKIVEVALEGMSATNATTKESVQGAIDAALDEARKTNADIAGVTVTVGELTKTEATESAAGSIKGSVTISCGEGADKATDNVSIDKPIAQLPAVKDTDWVLDADGKLTIKSDAGMTDWISKRTTYKTQIKSAEIQDGVTSIGTSAFYECGNLTSITVPNSVTSVSSFAFASCSSLTSITIPKDVTSIGNSVFQNCGKLTNVTMAGETPPAIGTSVFYGSGFVKNGAKGIHVPTSKADAYKAAWRDWAAYIADDTTADTHEHNGVTFTPWTETDKLPTDAGNYYLTEDVTLNATGGSWISAWSPADGTKLCLNGHTVKTVSQRDVIEVKQSITFSMYDCQKTGMITQAGATDESVQYGCGIRNNGTVHMYGGRICGNARKIGAGVYNDQTGTFYLHDGEISNNKASYSHGGAYNDGVFYMYGGRIAGNQAKFGGGLNNYSSNAKMYLYGGEIIGNHATSSYGGIQYSGGTMKIGGALVVKDNTAGSNNSTSNLCLWSNYNLIIELDSERPLESGAYVGITTAAEKPTLSFNINITGHNKDDYSGYFHSDNSSYVIVNNNNVVQLALPEYDVTVNGGTVNGGTGNASYKAGATVEITANAPESGKQFDKWVVNSGTVTLAGATNSTTTFTMPAEAVEVTAVYKDTDTTPPVIKAGDEVIPTEGTTEYEVDSLLKITVTDDNLASVKYNWTNVKVSGGSSVFSLSAGTYTIVATDKTGNKTTVSIIVREHDYDNSTWGYREADGHARKCKNCDKHNTVIAHTPGAAATEETPQTCTVCGYEISPALGHTHSLALTAAKAATCTEEGNSAYYTCSGCGKYFSDAAGTNEITPDSVKIPALGHDYHTSEWGYKGVDGHAHKCRRAGCGEHDTVVAHTPGAAATEEMPQTCTVCGYEISPALGHTHSLVLTAAKAATCTEEGNSAYYTCSGCGKYFSDAAGTNEITLDSVKIPALGHDYHTSEWGYKGVDGHAHKCRRAGCGEHDTVRPHTPGAAATAETPQTCTVCGYIIAPATGINPGTITPEVKPGANAPATNISTPTEELKDMLLTEEEKQQVQKGTDIRIVLEVQDAGNTVSASDKKAVRRGLNGFTAGQYLNIDLYKLVGQDRTNLTETTKKIRIVITVPDSLKNKSSRKTRTFAVIRVHDGKAELLTDLDGSADTITIDTDRFSTYAIVYKDTANGGSGGGNKGNDDNDDDDHNGGGNDNGGQNNPDKNDMTPNSAKDSEPKTGDTAPLELYATLSMIAGFAYLLLYFTDRKRGMTEETKKELVSRLVGWAKRGGKVRRYLALAAIFVLLVYYHSIGKKTCAEWKEIYGE